MPIDLENVVSSAEPAWFALYTRHQHERTVEQALSRKGFEVFLPLYWAVHRWKDRDKQVWLPLFPCYVFLHGDMHRQFDILSTGGVHFVVTDGQRPAEIPAREIEAIRQMISGGNRIEPHPFLKVGDRVRVKAGPLTGVEGYLVRKKNRFRLVVSLELLGRSAATEVDASILERIGSAKLLQAHSASSRAVA